MKIKCLAMLTLFLTTGLSTAAWAASSRDNRAESTVYLEVTPIGIDAATLLSTPVVGAGLYLGPHWQIGVEYGSRSYSLDIPNNSGTSNGKVDGTFVNYGAIVRWFPGDWNSFNLGLAVNQRNWDANFKDTITPMAGGPRIPVSAKLKTEATVPSFIVGNQWLMDFGMVIGLDWIVVSAPSASSSTFTLDPTTKAALAASSPADLNKAQKQGDDTGKLLNRISGFPGVLVFTIGWAF